MHLGRAFPDYLSRGRGRRVHRQEEPESIYVTRGWRLFMLLSLFFASFFLLEARLFHLTITKGVKNRVLSEGNRIREEIIPAPRGIIFDRAAVPLVRNIPFYRELLNECKGGKELCERVVDPVEARRRLSLGSRERLLFRIGREYLLKEKAAHLTGYIGEISEEEQKQLNASCSNLECHYQSGDLIGRGGVEERFESLLRGIDGKELVEVDAHEKEIQTLGKIPEISGQNLDLSIDSGLQDLAATLLASRSGAIIITYPPTGEILAMVSSPSFDPNAFSQSDERVAEILASRDQPLFNRAISGVYPPGSTFKIVTATAALEEKKITPETTIEDTGVISIGTYQFHNWYFTQYGKTDGAIDLPRAIARSNDIYFYRVGERLGIDLLSSWGKRFGFGTKTGIELLGESSGLVPDASWKTLTFGEPWYLGDTYHMAIGQGNLLVTPLQLVMMTDVIANNGLLCKPTILKQSAKNTLHLSNAPQKRCTMLPISPETIRVIRDGMKQACSSGGTGWPLFNFKVKSEKIKIDDVNFFKSPESTVSAARMVEIPVACKTGTSEYGDPKGKTHAWITTFAPVMDPQISITVLVEGGGEGSSVAGPIAKKIFEYWFSR